MRQRAAFTLIEMLIATGIFVVGFVSVYGMFLAGSKLRRQADSLTHSALATTSLIETLRLRADAEGLGYDAPSTYNGDGDPLNNDGGPEEDFVPFPDQPTIWYRFAHAADITGGDDANALGFRIILQVIDLGSTPTNADGGYALSVQEIGQRLRIVQDMASIYEPSLASDPSGTAPFSRERYDLLTDDDDKILFFLRMRALMTEQEAFITRRGR